MADFFVTTFNIPAWLQNVNGLSDAQLAPDGDGISGDGGWTTVLGGQDEITSLANMAAGGGGRGYRHVVGSRDNGSGLGVNDGGGGIKLLWTAVGVPEKSEFYHQFYFRFPSGFRWVDPGVDTINMKMVYHIGGPSSGLTGPHFYLGFVDNVIGGHVENMPNIGEINSTLTWTDIMGGALGDGLWHRYAYRVKVNSVGAVKNGILQIRIDGVQVFSRTDIDFTDLNNQTWGGILMGNNHRRPSNIGLADSYIDFDDVTFSDSDWPAAVGGGTGLAGGLVAQASATAALTTSSSQNVFFTEGFDDSNAGMLARNWIDGTEGIIDNTVFSPNGGSTGSLKFHWAAGNTNSDPQTGSRRHSISGGGTESLFVTYDTKFGTASIPWQGSGNALVHPHIMYILSDADNEVGPLAANYLNLYVEAGDVSGGNTKPRLLIQDNLRVNTGQLNVDLLASATAHSVAGWNGHQDQATPSLVDTYTSAGPTYHNYTSWDAPTRVLLNNTWHNVAIYAVMNSVSGGGIPQANGVLQLWVDGVLRIQRTNVYFRTNQYSTQKFKTLVLGPFMGDGSPIAQDMWMDNLKVADQPAGGFKSHFARNSNQVLML